LAADPVAQSLLAASIRKAATEQPSPVGDVPALAKSILGRTYRLDDNAKYVKTFSLNLAAPESTWGFEIGAKGTDRIVRFGGPIGLDGLFRTSRRDNGGIDAVKGRWLSARAFAIERRFLGAGATQQMMLEFDGKLIRIDYRDTDGNTAHLRGEEMP